MKNAGFKRLVAAAGIAGLLVGIGAGAAHAYVYESTHSTYYANPHTYEHWAKIDNIANTAGTTIRKSTGAAMGQYTVGAQARLYVAATGGLCTSSNFTITSSTVTQYSQSTNGTYCVQGYHYSFGVTKANAGGSTWIQRGTYQTNPIYL